MFDIESAAELFAMLRERFEQYCSDDEKSTEDAIFIVLIANHLREWIAPNYNPSKNVWPAATNDAQRFSKRVYENGDFRTIRGIANGTKHLRRSKTAPKTTTCYFGNAATGEIPQVVRIGHVGGQAVLKGMPAIHLIEDEFLEDILEPVIKLYQEWFEPQENSN